MGIVLYGPSTALNAGILRYAIVVFVLRLNTLSFTYTVNFLIFESDFIYINYLSLNMLELTILKLSVFLHIAVFCFYHVIRFDNITGSQPDSVANCVDTSIIIVWIRVFRF